MPFFAPFASLQTFSVGLFYLYLLITVCLLDYLSVCLSVCLSVWRCQPACLCVCVCACFSVWSVCTLFSKTFSLYFCSFALSPISLSVYPSLCLSVHPSLSLSVYIYISPAFSLFPMSVPLHTSTFLPFSFPLSFIISLSLSLSLSLFHTLAQTHRGLD